jgi:uncharacterized membrane protein
VARIEKIIEIQAPADVAYRSWRRLQMFPLLSQRPEKLEAGAAAAKWTARGPLGKRVRWSGQITEEVMGRRICWESNGGALTVNGRVDFIPADGGCVAFVVIDYRPPLGWLGEFVTDVLWDIEMRLERDISRLKTFIERPVVLPIRLAAEIEERAAVGSLVHSG